MDHLHSPPQPQPSRPRAIAEIADWLRLLVGSDPSSVFEIRALNCSFPGMRKLVTAGGYFSAANVDAAANAAKLLTIDRKAQGVYLTLNPVSPALLSRRANRVELNAAHDSTTSDADILSRRWLFIDCDPVRPSGISSSSAEHALAHSTALAIRSHLTSNGWPLPIVADSGNGWHLLYRISLPSDDTGIVQRCLHALAARFSVEKTLDIDTSVYNPSRICKLYGTFSRKGDHTEDRPHRRSRIVETPLDDPEVVPSDLLKLLASEAPEKKLSSGTAREQNAVRGSPIHRAEKWLEKRRPSVSQQKGHNNAYYTACVIVRGFGLTIDEATPLMESWNQYCEPPWSNQELRHKIAEASEKADGEPGYMLNGRSIPESLVSFLAESMTIDLTGFSDFPAGSVPRKNPLAFSSVRSGFNSFLGEV